MEKLFQCENKECRHEEYKEKVTENGILLGCNCPVCGWHMVDVKYEKS